MKIFTTLNKTNNIEDLNVDGYILGVLNMSQYIEEGFSISELEPIIKSIKLLNKEVFISLNKIMHNGDLKPLEELLISLDELHVSGILFGDIGVKNICGRLKLAIPLIWDQTHLVTNYHACNYWSKKGVSIANLSNELTMEEILDIRKNTNMKLMVQVFGFVPIFSSTRKLVSNYFDYLEKDNGDNNYSMYDEERDLNYPIRENNGTYIYSGKILNGINEMSILKDNDIDYVVINGFNLSNNDLKYVVDKFNNIKVNNNDTYEEINNKLPFPADKGFYYKPTIYKVREHE